jgi:hypothetical protein
VGSIVWSNMARWLGRSPGLLWCWSRLLTCDEGTCSGGTWVQPVLECIGHIYHPDEGAKGRWLDKTSEA